MKETAEYALSLAMCMWTDKVKASTVLSCIMRGEKAPDTVKLAAIKYISSHPVLDTLEQEFAIELIEVKL